jgi:anhydro-N-acetylmuramic acid kinase
LHVLGLMSGSSLDGLDLAFCRFELRTPATPVSLVDWAVLAADTVSYPAEWIDRLRSAPTLPGRELWRLHTDLGRLYGTWSARFLAEQRPVADLISSHGHTVFHFPAAGFTTQLGDGAAIAAQTGIDTVDQLRSADVALGGQGAPLAPLADRYFFPEYPACLNLGGIANLSVRKDNTYLAFDISGANQILDALAQEQGLAYDAGGALARRGRFRAELSRQLAALPFLAQAYPKSLDNGWVREQQWPIVRDFPAPTEDRLRTFCEHLAEQIAAHLRRVEQREGLPATNFRLLATGGGVHNTFFMECLQRACGSEVAIVVPPAPLADCKEAAFIALAGAFRLLKMPNSFASVTGARADAINGALYVGQRG